MFKIIPSVALLSLLNVSAVIADTSIFAKSTHEGSSESGVIYIQGNKVGFVKESEQGLQGFFDSQRKAVMVFDHEQKTYMEITEAFGKQMADTMGAMSKMLESATANMTPEQRQAVAGMMGGMMPQTPSVTAQVQYSLRDSGQSRDVNGIKCSVKAVYKGESKEGDACLASLSAAAIDAADYQTLKQLSQFGSSLAESLPFAKEYAGSASLFEQNKGFPVEINSRTYNMQVQKISQTVPANVFNIPAGYQKTDPMRQLGQFGLK